MPNIITTIRPTTEVQAVNVMLGAIGEALLADAADLSSLSGTDDNIKSAVEILKESVREVQTAGWRFNTLTGQEIGPTTTYVWPDTDGVNTTLNIFKVPVGVLAWKMTKCSEMQGADLIERRSFKYTEASAAVMVLFDRWKNRDGLEASRYPYIYLDAVLAHDFVDMPESARRLATIMAARRLAQRVPASDLQAAFTERDETQALRILKREQGLQQDLNFFDTVDGWNQKGQRPDYGGGFYTKVYPGGA